MKPWLLAVMVVSVLPLWGCEATHEEELREWMAQERAQTKPRVTPLTEPKQFQPQAYTVETGMDPFDKLKLFQALRKDSNQIAANASLIAPELARRKEPLEAYPLDTMTMVGSLQKLGKPTALMKVDGLLYQVQIGAYLGQNYGRIIAITETTVQLREIVQDAAGDWMERMATLELQEGAKK